MKSVLFGVLTLIFGLFLGRLAARGELEKSKSEMARVRQACERTDNLLPMFLGAQGFARAQRESDSGEPTLSEHGPPGVCRSAILVPRIIRHTDASTVDSSRA
jgi:hypothetical protein